MATMSEQTPRADRAVVIIEAAVAVTVVSAVIGTTYGPSSTVGFLLVGTALAATVTFLGRMVGALRDPALDVPPERTDTEREALEAEKAVLLQGIKELEGDSGTGKVDREDYHHLRRVAEARALEIIRQLNESDRRWGDEAEALIARRTGRATPAKAGATTVADLRPAAVASTTARAVAPRVALAAAHPGVFASGTTRLAPTAEGRVRCETCGAHSDADARYCTGCGRAKEAA
jgi:hypothetical protein